MEIDIFTQSKIDAEFTRRVISGLANIEDASNLKVSIIIDADASKPAVLKEIIDILTSLPGEHTVNILESALFQEILLTY